MLVHNPVTQYLYEDGYGGIEDIYDYWVRNEARIIEGYRKKNRRNQRDVDEDLKAFRLKVRWMSYYGFSIRILIDKMLRKSSHGVLDFGLLNGMFRNKQKGLDHFSRATLEAHEVADRQCLQGLSLINRQLSDVVVKDVDFSYAALNGSQFHKVIFSNCIFDHTSLKGCRFVGCTFEVDCVMVSNDFRKAYLDSRFMCKINDPMTNEQGVFGRKLWPEKPQNPYLNHTIIGDDSFLMMCD